MNITALLAGLFSGIAGAMGLGGGVESITFAGAEMTNTNGAFNIEKNAALNALGIVIPEGEENAVLATETVITEKVTEMSDELKAYIDEQIKNVEVNADSMDGGEFT